MVVIKGFLGELVRAFSSNNISILWMSFREMDYVMLVGFEEVELEMEKIKILGKPIFIKVG